VADVYMQFVSTGILSFNWQWLMFIGSLYAHEFSSLSRPYEEELEEFPHLASKVFPVRMHVA
jgi:hypothetical protein